ncbi:MAG: NHLP bacteriocin export ABC transporter permease/ATPase subunit [Clostridiales bacterium]|nr:NHLP bacteriocin export ABC transporter permease/ATPase subunit [Clostridiales bacterium]MDU3240569.1 NHLP bacteriocin export ABC transporter permease/ATPase subunit [Clostridiales bacterium]
MGWFDSQVKERLQYDAGEMQKSYAKLAGVVGKKEKIDYGQLEKEGQAKDALTKICKYYRIEKTEIPENIVEIHEQIQYLFEPSGVMWRHMRLRGKWWKDSMGPILGETKEGRPVALIPKAFSGYRYFDYESGKELKVDATINEMLKEDAICFYRPLPQKELTGKDLILFLLGNIGMDDKLLLGFAALGVTLLGLITPAANTLIFSHIIPAGQMSMVLSVAFLLFGAAISTFLMNITKTLVQTKIETKMSVILESAVMGRVINMPVQFFKNYNSGDLANRVRALESICSILANGVLGMGLMAVFSLSYILQIIQISSQLAGTAFLVILIQLIIAFLGAWGQIRVLRKKIRASSKVEGVVFALYSGIQKIKMSGSEKRAFVKWAGVYHNEADADYNPPMLVKIQKAVSPAVALFGTLLIYWVSVKNAITVANYVAFNVAYGMVSTAILSLVATVSTVAMIKPILELAQPILDTPPEISENKEIVKSVSGTIELNQVSFRYQEDTPLIIDDLSLKINRGQYVAIVGTTGCGKSTLMRLMLGFEKPDTGAVYYDGRDIQKVDLKSLRRQIGVVMQNGKLFSGDIFANITISAPWLALQDAWDAAEKAGIAQDIREMPMGMFTMIGEGAGGISGGQRQRLMIARAIAPKPKILMLDEATSALDNITQRQVSDALAELKSTRIVIAHRLSTIKACDRIIVLDKGRIIEDGTYEELNAKGGFFSELVKRQQLKSE